MCAIATLLLSVVWISAPSAQTPKGPAFAQEPTPANLQALLQRVFRYIHVDKSLDQAWGLFRTLGPDQRRLRRALSDDVAPEVLAKLIEFHKGFEKGWEGQLAKLASPEQTVVQVWGATTEEIRQYQEGSSAYQHFPGGARQVAERILRPGVTFYEAEFLEPGQTRGMTYHLFYWDGQQWSMLGPVWRVLQ
jgi:hypothetical protein